VGEALDRVVEALAGAREDDVTEVLSVLGASPPHPPELSASVRTPLPGPVRVCQIVSEVEWV
jgi:hypothetical protein